jgi:hypothetical protein
MATELQFHRTQKVGDRTYVYACNVEDGDIRWYYMPYGVWQMGGPFNGWELPR